jgi:hypothetical protein
MTPLESPFQSNPPLASCTAWTTSFATVPLLTLGIKPLGPKNLARVGFLVKRLNNSGVVINLSGTNAPLKMSLTSSSPPTTSAPARRAAAPAWPVAKTTRMDAFVEEVHEWGRNTRPRSAFSWIVEEGFVWMLSSYAASLVPGDKACVHSMD